MQMVIFNRNSSTMVVILRTQYRHKRINSKDKLTANIKTEENRLGYQAKISKLFKSWDLMISWKKKTGNRRKVK